MSFALRRLLSSLRPDAVALVDAWDFHDRQLGPSTLGRADGRVYDAVLDMARRSPLNTEMPEADYRDALRPLDLPPSDGGAAAAAAASRGGGSSRDKAPLPRL